MKPKLSATLPTRILVALAGIAIASLALAGCTAGAPVDHSMHSTNPTAQAQTEMSSDDIMFAQMMIPHHQQAVDMGVLAETRAGREEVKKLAEEIKNEQAPEIALMKSWLEAAGAPVEMGHSMQMSGLLNASQMANLEAASGDQFDKLYLLSMIEHHKGAIEMAQSVVESKNADVRALAEAIISSQSDQITYIESLLGNN